MDRDVVCMDVYVWMRNVWLIAFGRRGGIFGAKKLYIGRGGGEGERAICTHTSCYCLYLAIVELSLGCAGAITQVDSNRAYNGKKVAQYVQYLLSAGLSAR